MRTFNTVSWLAFVTFATWSSSNPVQAQSRSMLTGRSALTDFRSQSPGTMHRITVADLPQPHETPTVDNGPRLVARPKGAWPQVMPGHKVELYATGFDNPRLIRTASNGDIFLAESRLGQIKILRGIKSDGTAAKVEVFAEGLRQPFGIAFYPSGAKPRWVYVGNTDSVVRFEYGDGDLKARAPAQHIVDLPAGGRLRGGGHWTRDIAFSRNGKKLYVSVGSVSNNDDPDDSPAEFRRADVLEFNPDGTKPRVYAWGIRNAVGIAVHPQTGELWGSVNERDTLGDDLPPDYITHIKENGFYGWPWYYIGANSDPRHQGKHPELKHKVIVPDVLIQPHNASLELVFYDGKMFDEYRGDIFAAEHGSWNRAKRTGYEVIRVPMHNKARATGEYEDFLTGFVTAEGEVWGRPVGVAVASDGSLLVSDDGSNSVWRISRVGST